MTSPDASSDAPVLDAPDGGRPPGDDPGAPGGTGDAGGTGGTAELNNGPTALWPPPSWSRIPLVVVATLVVWYVANLVLPNGAPPGEVLSGAIVGSATGLTAVGLILVWRANRIINFANGAMAGVAGLFSVHLFISWGWPYPFTIISAMVIGSLVGGLVEFTIIRRFANAPRLVLTVATIGLAQLLGGIELLIPGHVFGAAGLVLGAFETPLNKRLVRCRSRAHQRQPPADRRRRAGGGRRPGVVPAALAGGNRHPGRGREHRPRPAARRAGQEPHDRRCGRWPEGSPR